MGVLGKRGLWRAASGTATAAVGERRPLTGGRRFAAVQPLPPEQYVKHASSIQPCGSLEPISNNRFGPALLVPVSFCREVDGLGRVRKSVTATILRLEPRVVVKQDKDRLRYIKHLGEQADETSRNTLRHASRNLSIGQRLGLDEPDRGSGSGRVGIAADELGPVVRETGSVL